MRCGRILAKNSIFINVTKLILTNEIRIITATLIMHRKIPHSFSQSICIRYSQRVQLPSRHTFNQNVVFLSSAPLLRYPQY